MTASSFLPMRRVLRLLMLLVAALMLHAPAHAADDFLPPEQAFRFSAKQLDGQTVEVKFGIADGYYMYRERLAVAADPATVTFAPLELPAGKIKHDENFNKEVETYRHALVFHVKAQDASAPFTLVVTSQGCADQGLCYPPMKSRFQVEPASASSAPTAPGAAVVSGTESSSDDKLGRIASTLGSGNLGAIALLFFGFGLLLTFTPCVLPMLPIISAIVVGEHATRMRAALVSVAYVLGMATVYTALGVAAGLAGQGLQAALQNPWVLGAFALLIALLSLSMFGLYELQLASPVDAGIQQAERRPDCGRRRHGGAVGVDRFTVRDGTLGGGARLHCTNRQRGHGGYSTVCPVHGDGRAADSGGRGRRQSAAALGALADRHQGDLRFHPARCGSVHRAAGLASVGRDGGLGRIADRRGRVSADVRFAARRCE